MLKSLVAAVLVLGSLVSCSNKDENGDTIARTPVDNYCLQYGQYDNSRCPGFNYNYNNGGYNYGYNTYGVNPNYAQWANYNYYGNYYSQNYNYGGCGVGYAPVYGQSGLACYYVNAGVNYYYWQPQTGYSYGGYQGFLVGCGPTWACPSGYACSNSYGAGVCVY